MAERGRPHGTIRLVAVDHHELARLGMAWLAEHGSGLVLAGEAANAAEAVRVVAEAVTAATPPPPTPRAGRMLEIASAAPVVVSVSTDLPGGGGISLIRQLRRGYPHLGLLLLCSDNGEEYLARGRELGLSAVVSRSMPVATIAAAIRAAGQRPDEFHAPGLLLPYRRPPSSPPLSGREREVLALLAAGDSLSAIAEALKISPGTAKTYVSRLYAKLQVRNRTQALLVTARRGLLAPPAGAADRRDGRGDDRDGSLSQAGVAPIGTHRQERDGAA